MTAKKFNTLIPSDRVKKVQEAIAAGRPLVEPPRKPGPDKGAKSPEGTVNPNPVPDARKFSASMKLFVTKGKLEITLYKENSRTNVNSEDEIELQDGLRIGRLQIIQSKNPNILKLLKQRSKAVLVIVERRVSKQHAIILLESQPDGTKEWVINDLESMNGTYVNARRVIKSCELHDGDKIHIGSIRLEVSITTAAETITMPFPPSMIIEPDGNVIK